MATTNRICEIQSESNPNARPYMVSRESYGDVWSCSCRGWTMHMPRKDCKHIREVRAELRDNPGRTTLALTAYGRQFFQSEVLRRNNQSVANTVSVGVQGAIQAAMVQGTVSTERRPYGGGGTRSIPVTPTRQATVETGTVCERCGKKLHTRSCKEKDLLARMEELKAPKAATSFTLLEVD